MYLTELYRFYERMTQDPQSGMPPEGMSAEAIHFALVIGEDGSLKGVHDLRDSKGKPLRRFSSDSRQTGKLFNQTGQRHYIIFH